MEEPHPLHAMILCAGLGTRLRPLTDELPKPLVPVGDRSILAHAVEQLAALGMDSIAINVHHLASIFHSKIKSLPARIHVVEEREIRGTAGGVAGARALFAPGPALIWNGDIRVEPPVREALALADTHGMCLCVVERPLGAGTVGLDANGGLVRLRGERFGKEQRSADYVGVLALSEQARAELPERGCLFGDFALPLLRRGARIATARVSGGFLDAGDPGSLLRANLDWLAARGDRAYVAPGAEVARGVELDGSVVCAGARVRGAGAVRECLICEGAEVTAPLDRAIVTPSGRIIPTPARI